jgi:hypothetical protein
MTRPSDPPYPAWSVLILERGGGLPDMFGGRHQKAPSIPFRTSSKYNTCWLQHVVVANAAETLDAGAQLLSVPNRRLWLETFRLVFS